MRNTYEIEVRAQCPVNDDDMDLLPSKWDDDAPTVTALVALDAIGVPK